MLIPSSLHVMKGSLPSLSRRVNANSQLDFTRNVFYYKLIKKGEC